jgi:hypothetical protein
VFFGFWDSVFSIQSKSSRLPFCVSIHSVMSLPLLGALLFFGPSPNVVSVYDPAFPSPSTLRLLVYIFSLLFLTPFRFYLHLYFFLLPHFVAYLPACVSIPHQLIVTILFFSPRFLSLVTSLLLSQVSISAVLISFLIASRKTPSPPPRHLCFPQPCALVHYSACSLRARVRGRVTLFWLDSPHPAPP